MPRLWNFLHKFGFVLNDILFDPVDFDATLACIFFLFDLYIIYIFLVISPFLFFWNILLWVLVHVWDFFALEVMFLIFLKLVVFIILLKSIRIS